MTKVPQIVRQRLANATYYLQTADALPPPTRDAAHILLLLVGWENAALAEHELHVWAHPVNLDPKVKRDHAAKLDAVDRLSSVQYVKLGPRGTHAPAITTQYSTGRELTKLREICQYGSDTETRDVAKLFHRGWHADDLRRGLHQKIEWIDAWIPLYEHVVSGRRDQPKKSSRKN